MSLYELLERYQVTGKSQGTHYDLYRAGKTTKWELTEENIEKFNNIYRALIDEEFTETILTPGGNPKKTYKNCRSFYVKATNPLTVIKLIIITDVTTIITIGHEVKSELNDDKPIYPSQSWAKFVEICAKHDIDLNDYAIKPAEGKFIKMFEFGKAKISCTSMQSETDPGLENCHHIDFHSSHPAGLANTHPEFRPVIEELYNKRKEEPVYKAILNQSWGSMQSVKKPWNCRWTHLAKDALDDTNNRLEDMTERLIEAGNTILGYNTDGIWYQGNIYHGEGEGEGLGEWRNDHINCIMRWKSSGAYEFIEDGKYYPVVRGRTRLDAEYAQKGKGREDWQWGDIYRAGETNTYYFDEEKGILKENLNG